MKLHLKLIYFIFMYLIHGNKFKIGGPILVRGGSCDWFTSCCSSSSGSNSDKKKSSNSSGTDSDKSKSNSSDGSTFEIDVNAQNERKYGQNYSFNDGSGIKLYRINNNKKCSKVKFGDKDVWKYDTGDYPEKVRYVKNDKKIYIHFSNNVVKTFKQNNDNWEEETEGTQGGKKGDQDSTGSKPAEGSTTDNQSSGGTTGTGGSGAGSTPATQ